MKNGKVQYALIGFGGIAENRVAKEGFAMDKARFPQAMEHFELVGAFDLNPARQSAAEALGLKWYPSIDEILADKDIDAVYIATNNASHAALAIKALEAGKHVMCEKPIATSVADAEAMRAKAIEKNLSLGADHMMVNNAFNRLAKAELAKGVIGNVNDSTFHMQFLYGATPQEAATWRCSKIEEMGGPIGDVASHCFYMAEFMFDSKIVAVAASYIPKTMDIVAENGAYIKFTMENGLQGAAMVSFSEARGGFVGTMCAQGYEIYGDKGVMRGIGTMFQFSGHKDEPFKPHLEFETAEGVKQLVPTEFQNIYQAQIDAHAVSIISG
ncbi:MAG: Gfo/Idh/MocA family oxidoreductase, partial [Lentisphaeria bacterium]|nr:Gfo/Idh/MocA family oxidoreductase [Lentisphaeria bacterium]